MKGPDRLAAAFLSSLLWCFIGAAAAAPALPGAACPVPPLDAWSEPEA